MELRNLLVPVADNAESERAMDVACRLADEHRATIAVLHVVEVPPVLPLGAHMTEEHLAAHRLLERTAAIADTYGLKVVPRTLQDRVASVAIIGFAARRGVELIVIGAPRKRRKPFGSTVEHVLRKADCRVLMIAAAPTQGRDEPSRLIDSSDGQRAGRVPICPDSRARPRVQLLSQRGQV